tara:strand:+ start:852 stop:1268 length:417 start_codon:yes stop_codon:yes gene_type:complete
MLDTDARGTIFVVLAQLPETARSRLTIPYAGIYRARIGRSGIYDIFEDLRRTFVRIGHVRHTDVRLDGLQTDIKDGGAVTGAGDGPEKTGYEEPMQQLHNRVPGGLRRLLYVFFDSRATGFELSPIFEGPTRVKAHAR